MSGLGNVEMRQAVWEKQYWKGADEGDQKLDFEEMERLCKRLNINSSTDTLLRLFKVSILNTSLKVSYSIHCRKRTRKIGVTLILRNFSISSRC